MEIKHTKASYVPGIDFKVEFGVYSADGIYLPKKQVEIRGLSRT